MSDSILCTEDGIRQVQEALREQDLDGWLLYEFRGANPIAKSMLGVGKTTRQLNSLPIGFQLADVVGPLGKPTDIEKVGHVVAGGEHPAGPW